MGIHCGIILSARVLRDTGRRNLDRALWGYTVV